MKRTAFIAAIFLLIWFACTSACQNPNPPVGNNNTPPPMDTVTNGGALNPQQAQIIISQRANQVLQALTNNNTAQLLDWVHPQKGVRFTPYAYVQPDSDLVFDVQKTAQLAADSTLYIWGSYDGTGDPIILTYNSYRARFVTDKNYLQQSDSIGYNQIIGKGNSLNNRTEVYPTAIIVEYYQSGKHPHYGGMDWGSLALVFEKYQGQWYLVGIIHNSWTI